MEKLRSPRICKVEHLVSSPNLRSDLGAPYRDACEEFLKLANGRAKAFAVTSHHDLVLLAERAERKLEKHGVTKAARAGTFVQYRPAGPKEQSYINSAASTSVLIHRNTTSWIIVNATPTMVSPNQRELFTLTIGDEAVNQIIRRALEEFMVGDVTIIRHLTLYGRNAYSAVGRLSFFSTFTEIEANPNVVGNGVFITPPVSLKFALFSEDLQALQNAMAIARLSHRGLQFDPIKAPLN